MSFEVAQTSRGAATSNSLGREPQEIVVESSSESPGGATSDDATLCVAPPGLSGGSSTLSLGLTPQAIRCRPSGTKKRATSKSVSEDETGTRFISRTSLAYVDRSILAIVFVAVDERRKVERKHICVHLENLRTTLPWRILSSRFSGGPSIIVSTYRADHHVKTPCRHEGHRQGV